MQLPENYQSVEFTYQSIVPEGYKSDTITQQGFYSKDYKVFNYKSEYADLGLGAINENRVTSWKPIDKMIRQERK